MSEIIEETKHKSKIKNKRSIKSKSNMRFKNNMKNHKNYQNQCLMARFAIFKDSTVSIVTQLPI